MKTFLLKISILAFAFFGFAGSAHALIFDFTATGFTANSGSAVPETDLAGSITIEGNIVTDIDLTIGSHTYSTGEVGYEADWIVGGLATGINVIAWGTTDFWITGDFSETAPSFSSFYYSVMGVEDIFYTFDGTLTVRNEVPAPASVVLLALGLTALGFGRRKSA